MQGLDRFAALQLARAAPASQAGRAVDSRAIGADVRPPQRLHSESLLESHSVLNRLRQLADALEKETYALFLAYKDPRVPWYAKAFAAVVVAHTFSPIDTIPDFIPVLGYLDDLLITPLGIFLALKMIPSTVMAEARERAALAKEQGEIRSRAGVAIVLAIWAVGVGLLAFVIYRYAGPVRPTQPP